MSGKDHGNVAGAKQDVLSLSRDSNAKGRCKHIFKWRKRFVELPALERDTRPSRTGQAFAYAGPDWVIGA